jgi:hypothetical protein
MISRLFFKLAAWFFGLGIFMKVIGFIAILILACIIWVLW